MPRYTINLTTPYPDSQDLPSVEFTTPTTSVRIKTAISVGFESAEIGYPVKYTARDGHTYTRRAYLPEPISRYVERGGITIGSGAETLFEGRMGPPRYSGTDIMGVTARGPAVALRDLWLDSTSTATMKTGHLIREVLRRLMPQATIGTTDQFGEPGIEHSLSEFHGMTAGEIVDALTSEGGTDGNPWDFQFWEGHTAHLKSRAATGEPTYTMPFGAPGVSLTHDPDERISHVTVVYTVPDEDSESSLTYPPLTSGTVTRHVRIEAGQLSDAGAYAFARAYHAERSVRRWSGTIEFATERGLPLWHGGERAKQRVRADGARIHIEGLPRTSEDGEPESPLLIVSTEYETGHTGDRLRLQVGTGFVVQSQRFRYYRRAVERMQAGLNPVTGQRAG